jgi:hypothetical protein
MPLKFEFISESRRLTVQSESAFSDGELWRIIGIPTEVPVGKRFKVTLEEVPESFGDLSES